MVITSRDLHAFRFGLITPRTLRFVAARIGYYTPRRTYCYAKRSLLMALRWSMFVRTGPVIWVTLADMAALRNAATRAYAFQRFPARSILTALHLPPHFTYTRYGWVKAHRRCMITVHACVTPDHWCRSNSTAPDAWFAAQRSLVPRGALVPFCLIFTQF